MYVGYAEFSHPSWLGLVCRHATAHHHMAAPAHSGVYRWQMRANRAEGTVSQRQVAYPFFCVVQLRTALVMTPGPSLRQSLVLTALERKEFEFSDLDEWMREADQVIRRSQALLDRIVKKQPTVYRGNTP